VQRYDDRSAASGQRGQRGEPEMRVDDVERGAPGRALDRRGGPRQRARSGREGEHLDRDVVAPLQGLDLVAHEDAALRGGVGRPHVRHDERAHRSERTFVAKTAHS
jgi:hypothetical protein